MKVDGHAVAKLRRGEVVRVEVVRGTHEVEFIIDWKRDRIQVEVEDGSSSSIVCRPGGNASNLLDVLPGRRYFDLRVE